MIGVTSVSMSGEYDHFMTAPWSQDAGPLLASLGTHEGIGLTSSQVEVKKLEFGDNALTKDHPISLFSIFLRQTSNPMVYTLVLAGCAAFFMREFLNAVAIMSIVIINIVIGFAHEYKAEEGIQALKQLTVPTAKVLRDGHIVTLLAEDVVPGDILHLEAGDYVVADARIIQVFQLTADESVLTGESIPVEKNLATIEEDAPLADRKNMVFASTAISSGSARAAVTAIGMKTEIGKIAGLIKETEHQSTPLQKRLEKVSQKLLFLGGGVIVAVIVLGIYQKQGSVSIFIAAISLAVAAIPEGLPTVVTLALTLAIRRITRRNALVRKLDAVETLGSVDMICTDKTGTLTTGKMRVREIFTLEEGCVGAQSFKGSGEFFDAIILCNNASLYHGNSGDATEVALLLLAKDHGQDLELKTTRHQRLQEWSFDSERKRMSVAVKEGNKFLIYSKGAPEVLLPLCQLRELERRKVEEKIIELTSLGRRILLIARKVITDRSLLAKGHFEVEVDLHFLGLISMADPPKPESMASIKECKASGIRVVMLTGDHPVTALAIARELGIAHDQFDHVLTGNELDRMNSEELAKKVEHTAVYARVTPEHKLKIVEALQRNKHIVSMTGDGVNDAPALKRASIGVSMGMTGTEVARQASSLILTDDNFSTIVSAIEEGRAIYGNIKRTIQYLLSTNLAEILIVLGASIFALPTPLNPISLLWINLVTDGFPSLALAAEPVEKGFLKTSLHPSPESFFDKSFMKELFLVGVSMTCIEMIVYLYAIKHADLLTAKSYALSLLVYLSLFRSFSCRSETKTFFELPLNSWHLASVLVPISLQFFLHQMPITQKIFEVRPLSIHENMILIVLGLLPVALVELTKILKKDVSVET